MVDPINDIKNFDPEDEVSYYYGNLNRDHVKEILSDALIGTFLIRDSTKDFDQKVLCVKEAPDTINSYKIIHTVKNLTNNNSGGDEDDDSDENTEHAFYIFGKQDCLFSSIPKILEFYSTHYLNQSPLVRPAFHHKKVIAMFDFQEGGDPNEDLYFQKNDILTVLEYTQGEHWWNASLNEKTGLIPATLVRRLKPNEVFNEENNLKNNKQKSKITEIAVKSKLDENNDSDSGSGPMQCPFNARVIEDYTPSPYETSHIALKKGQIIVVLEMKSIGKWFGQIESGKKGLFPFNRVEFIKN